MSDLNQPFLPSLSLSAPQLLGQKETQHIPTTMGFAASFPDIQQSSTGCGPPAKTVHDIEIALNANWRRITEKSEKRFGTPRNQLENKTGLEVAVLSL